MPAFYPEGDEPKLADPSGRSLHKINNLLKSIDAKTGSTTITGPVTVTNEVEIKNDANNPLPVSDNGGSLTVDGTVSLSPDSLSALENISVTFPATQNVSVQNTSLAVTDNGGSLTVDGTITAAQATAANLNATVVGSGSFTAAQATASNLKAQAQLLNASGSVVDYAMTGTAGTPASDVVTIQGIVGGTNIQVSDKGSTGPTTVTNFTSTSSLALMSANSARKLLAVFNEGAGTLYVLYGAGTASTSNYSVRLNSGDYLEIEKYTGAVTGIFGTAGTARVTEVT